jgi:hypothetical protein
MKTPVVLPEAFLRCISPEQRKNVLGGQLTAEEAISRAEVKNERALQSQIVNLLRLKGIEPLWHRTDKKSAATIGWPDLTFAVPDPCAWEVKFGDGKLSDDQVAMHLRLQTPPNCWRVRTIRSVDEALAELKELGL